MSNIMTTKVSLYRNIEGYKYPRLLSSKEGKALTKIISDVVTKETKFTTLEISSISQDVENEYMAKGYISTALMNNANFSGVAISKDNRCRVFINADNHIEINVVGDKLDIKNDYNIANDIDDKIGTKLKYDYDEVLGYLTQDITSVGTALKVYVDIFLPSVVYTGKVNSLYGMLSKMGVDIADVSKEYGMNSVFRISNIATLGKKEDQILTLIDSTVKKLLDIERDASQAYLKGRINVVKDSVYRAYGILKNSYIMTQEECSKCMTILKYGVDNGLIDFDKQIDFSKILVETNENILQNKCKTNDVDINNPSPV